MQTMLPLCTVGLQEFSYGKNTRYLVQKYTWPPYGPGAEQLHRAGMGVGLRYTAAAGGVNGIELLGRVAAERIE